MRSGKVSQQTSGQPGIRRIARRIGIAISLITVFGIFGFFVWGEFHGSPTESEILRRSFVDLRGIVLSGWSIAVLACLIGVPVGRWAFHKQTNLQWADFPIYLGVILIVWFFHFTIGEWKRLINQAATDSHAVEVVRPHVELADLAILALNESITGYPDKKRYPLRFELLERFGVRFKEIKTCKIRLSVNGQQALGNLLSYLMKNWGGCVVDRFPERWPEQYKTGTYIYGNSDHMIAKAFHDDLGVEPVYLPLPGGFEMEGYSGWVEVGPESMWQQPKAVGVK